MIQIYHDGTTVRRTSVRVRTILNFLHTVFIRYCKNKSTIYYSEYCSLVYFLYTSIPVPDYSAILYCTCTVAIYDIGTVTKLCSTRYKKTQCLTLGPKFLLFKNISITRTQGAISNFKKWSRKLSTRFLIWQYQNWI